MSFLAKLQCYSGNHDGTDMKIEQLGAHNAYVVRFEPELLDELRQSYLDQIKPFLELEDHQKFLVGGEHFSQKMDGNDDYYLTTYGRYPLLWLSTNTPTCYALYRQFLDTLAIEDHIRKLIDHDKRLVMYCGFMVVGNQAPGENWHVDYYAGAPAFTLMTPLFELQESHRYLRYQSLDGTQTYRYELGEAIIFGEGFTHSTAPYATTQELRVLISITFGTDKLKYWDVIEKTVGAQSKQIMLPCGHWRGQCRCLNKLSIRAQVIARKILKRLSGKFR